MDIDPQAIILLVFMVIAFLKFVGENLKGKKQQEEDPGTIEELYESTREEILERQRGASPPPGGTGDFFLSIFLLASLLFDHHQ